MEKEKGTMLDMAQDALVLSEWQRQIGQAAQGADPRSVPPGDVAEMQQGLRQGLRKSMRKLDSLSMTPPDALRDVARGFEQADKAAGRALSALSSSSGAPEMARSGAALDNLARNILDAAGTLDRQMQGQGAGGGMMSGMRKLSAKQAALNAATADMLRMMLQGQGGQQAGGSAQGNEQARASAEAAQKAIAEQLRQLAEKYGSEAAGGGRGRLEELEQEARRMAEMLRHPQQDLRDRQDRFLVRMLQTALSMHRQDEGKEERKSEAARQVFSDKPLDDTRVDPGTTDLFYRLRQQALRGNFPEEYRLPVEAYFDSLGTMFLR
jgi:hypothetical protein